MGAPTTATRTLSQRRSISLQRLFELDSDAHNGVSSSTKLPLPPSRDQETEDLVDTISKCNYLFNFIDPSESPSKRDTKHDNLSRILDIVSSKKHLLTSGVLGPLIAMIGTNLFRPLPPPAFPSLPIEVLASGDDFPLALAHSWPHLHIIYDILAAVVANSDAKALRRHINKTFLSNLAALFQSEDPRERDRLKKMYHQIYAAFPAERAFMRRSMSSIFLAFILDGERHCGIGELLEIYGSILNGFMVPLKEEHRVFLMKVLLPLHKPRWAQNYHGQLSYCVLEFLRKEPELSDAIVKGILRYWPVSNCQKELLFIAELEEIVDVMDTPQFQKVALPLCSRIARCLISSSSQVAEKGLYFWNNEHFVRMASSMGKEIIAPMVGGIEKNLKLHWSKSVQQVTVSVKKLLEEIDSVLYAKCLRELELLESSAWKQQITRKARWDIIEMAADGGRPSHSVCV